MQLTWISFGSIALFISLCVLFVFISNSSKISKLVSAIVGVILVVVFLCFALTHLSNHRPKSVKVYASDGNVIAQYQGNMQILSDGRRTITIDFDGNRYTYHNCSIEIIEYVGVE